MPNYKVVDADELDATFSGIANAVREKTGKSELLKDTEIETEIRSIQAGGMYKELWEKIENADKMFLGSDISVGELEIPNAKSCSRLLDSCKNISNINIKLPKGTDLGSILNQSSAKKVIIEAPNATSYSFAFSGSSVEEVFLSSSDKVTNWEATFYGSVSLQKLFGKLQFIKGVTNLTFLSARQLSEFTPVRIATSINLSSCPLDLASGKQTLIALDDFSGTEFEFQNTVTLSTKTWALLDAEGDTASPNGNSWRAYANDKGYKTS